MKAGGWRAETALLHQPRWPATGFEAVQPGVFKASTVFFADTAAWRRRDWLCRDAFIYGTHGTPTTFELEARIAALEGAQHALLCPSGIAAIALVYQALLVPGDEVLVPVNVYPGHRYLLLEHLVAWGLRPVSFDPMEPAGIPWSAGARLLWLEAPCSLTLEFPDVREIAARAAAAGVVVALDNTWGAGIAFPPFELGVDLSVQALTKYASGGGDVVMGSISTRARDLHDALKACALRLGHHVSPSDAADVLRGLPTLALRYEAHDERARQLAAWLQRQPAVAEVLHPALATSAGHATWARECRAAAGVFSVVFHERHERDAVDRFVDALQLFRIGFSWGGPVSIVLPGGDALAPARPLRGELVRLSVGLEAVEDLQADLQNALCVLQ
jgi:cystathionine beta-lyase